MTYDGGAAGECSVALPSSERLRGFAAWFHELDAWTEYWDLYHPETRGRYYFGDGVSHPGLLSRLLPSPGSRSKPAIYEKWCRLALYPNSSGIDRRAEFAGAARDLQVAEAVRAMDTLVLELFARHFGRAAGDAIVRNYLEAMFLFGIDALPPATERAARVPADDLRRATAGRHTIDADLMWFAWALHLEAAHALSGEDERHAERNLLLAGVAVGCSANFAWRAHRRTRSEYRADAATAELLRERGCRWARDWAAASREIHALYQIREWGQ